MVKLFKDDVENIVKLYQSGMSFTEIAKYFDVTRTTITRKLKTSGTYKLENEKRCELCGSVFYPSKYGSQIQRFCSDNCRHKSFIGDDSEPVYIKCKHCGKMFERRSQKMYCSVECREKQAKLDKKKHQKIKQCKYCCNWWSGSAGIYCSDDCRRKGNRLKDELRKNKRYQKARKNGLFDADIDIYKLIERDGGHCYLCGGNVLFSYHYNHPKYPTIEHVIPIAKGGTHSWDNVKVACRECNTRKSTILVDEFLGGDEFGSTKVNVATKVEED